MSTTRKCRSSARYAGMPSGMTLIEMLVVIAVIAILAAITFPALAAARESARKLWCRSNLQQLAQGMLMHEQTHEFLPHGGFAYWNPPTYRDASGVIGPKGTPSIGAQQYAGWGFQVLPYIGEQNLWDQGAIAAVATPTKLYFCPSRSGPRAMKIAEAMYPFDVPQLGAYPLTVPEHAQTDYASAYVDPFSFQVSDPRFHDNLNPADVDQSGAVIRLRLAFGPVPLVSPISVSNLTDGASNVMLFSEKRMNGDAVRQEQFDDNTGFTSGWDIDVNRNASIPPAADYHRPKMTVFPTSLEELKLLHGFGSAHKDGLNAVMADGSAKFYTYSIDPLVWHRMGARADGKALNQKYQ